MAVFADIKDDIDGDGLVALIEDLFSILGRDGANRPVEQCGFSTIWFGAN